MNPVEKRFYLTDQSAEWKPNGDTLLRMAKVNLDQEEERDFLFTCRTLNSFEWWLRSPDVDPSVLPLLQGAFVPAGLAFGAYTESRFGETTDFGNALFARQVAVSLCQILCLVREMAENRVVWKEGQWVRTTDGYHVFKAATLRPTEMRSIYYAPGRETLSFDWQNTNPWGRKTENIPIYATVRFEAGKEGYYGRLLMDFSVRETSLMNFRGRHKMESHSSRQAVSLTKFVFGERHRLLIFEGRYEDCMNRIHALMEFLHVSWLFKTVGEVPREEKFIHTQKIAV